jgi:hypothetical protein
MGKNRVAGFRFHITHGPVFSLPVRLPPNSKGVGG